MHKLRIANVGWEGERRCTSCESQMSGGKVRGDAQVRIANVGWEIAHAAVSRRTPIPLSRIVALTNACSLTPRKVGICPSFKGHFLSRRATPKHTMLRNLLHRCSSSADSTAVHRSSHVCARTLGLTVAGTWPCVWQDVLERETVFLSQRNVALNTQIRAAGYYDPAAVAMGEIRPRDTHAPTALMVGSPDSSHGLCGGDALEIEP
jgi:hypothetical protein